MLKILLFKKKLSGKTVARKDLVEKYVEVCVNAANLLFQTLLLCCVALVWPYKSLQGYTSLVLPFWSRHLSFCSS